MDNCNNWVFQDCNVCSVWVDRSDCKHINWKVKKWEKLTFVSCPLFVEPFPKWCQWREGYSNLTRLGSPQWGQKCLEMIGVCLFVFCFLSVCLFVCLFFVCLSVCLPVCLFVCLSLILWNGPKALLFRSWQFAAVAFIVCCPSSSQSSFISSHYSQTKITHQVQPQRWA